MAFITLFAVMVGLAVKGTGSAECVYRMVDRPYRGTVNITRNGLPCQRWDSQSPHVHGYKNVSFFPDHSLTEALNYCREPSGLHYMMGRPWCYTLHEDTPWEFCDVPLKECFNGGKFNSTSCACDCDGTRYTGNSCETGTMKHWPSGPYALPMSSFSCPSLWSDKGENWLSGGVSLGLGDQYSRPSARDSFWRKHYNYMGPYMRNSFIHHFCIKPNWTADTRNVSHNGDWMAGKYCVYQADKTCPTGFVSTSVALTSRQGGSRQSIGSLPFVSMSGATLRVHFCCRRDGSVSSPIILPPDIPFYLIKEASADGCQAVERMRVKQEAFPLDEEVLELTNASRPYLEKQGQATLHLCSYQSYEVAECYDPRDNGLTYRGTKAVTVTNRTCDVWERRTHNYFHATGTNKYSFFYNGLEANSHCRLPDLRERPWCYYKDESDQAAWGYCDIKPCSFDKLNMPNIALYKPTKLSSLRRPSLGGSLAVDGKEKTCAWSGEEASPWLQINLQSIHLIQSLELIIDRHTVSLPLHRHLDIQVGMTSEDFLTRGAILCRHDVTFGMGLRAWLDCVQPIKGQYVTIQNTVFYDGHRSSLASILRLCEVKVYGYATGDGLPLGMSSLELAPNSFNVSSSAHGVPYSSSVTKDYGRLYDQNVGMTGGAWCADTNDPNKYFQVDLGRQRVLQSVMTRGLDTSAKDAPSSFTSSYFVTSSMHGSVWTEYRDGLGQIKNFSANMDNFTPVRNVFDPQLVARYIRINVLTFVGFPCLRFELYGRKNTSELDCGEEVTEPGRIRSPNFPHFYGENRICTWVIRFETENYVALDFLNVSLASSETARLEGGYVIDPGNCTDNIKVLVPSKSGIWAAIRHLTGEPLTAPIIAPTEQLRVVFRSCFRYSYPQANGFQVQISKSKCAGYGVGQLKCPGIHHCTAKCGVLASANYPFNYNSDHTCKWHIRLQPRKYVALKVEDFEVLDTSGDCSDDFLDVKDVDVSGKKKLLGRYCSGVNTPNEIIYSSRNEMFVTFVAERSSSGRGFRAKYTEYQYNVSADIYEEWAGQRANCEDGWEGFRGYCYRLYITRKTSWIWAEKRCNQAGGHLVSIRDRSESSFLHFLLMNVWEVNRTHVYIGLTDRQMEGHFEWSDGSQLTYTDWYTPVDRNLAPQPNGGEKEDCGVVILGNIQSTAYWHDIACANDDVSQFVCEILWSDRSVENSTSSYPHTLAPIQHNVSICPSDHFSCVDGECVSSIYRCDGLQDCSDHSDELECEPGCGPLSFVCDSGQCISISLYCDFNQDCTDGSDEHRCVRRSCRDEEFRCRSGQCIPFNQRCDVQTHCMDGSDEIDCAFCKPGVSFKCYDGRCVPKSAQCDGQVDCNGLDHEDESARCWEETAKGSCGEWREAGYTRNGLYDIVPRNSGEHSKVECIFEDEKGRAVNVFRHNLENRSQVKNIEWNYNREIVYLHASYGDIRTIVTRADNCEMFMKYDCMGSMSGKGAAGVVTYIGTAVEFTAPTGQSNCWQGYCSCNRNDIGRWLEDGGYLNNTHLFPLVSVRFGDTGSKGEEAYHTIGPLRCYEEVDFQKAQSAFVCRNQRMTQSKWRCLHQYDQFGFVVGCRDLSHLENCELHQCPKDWYKCPASFCILAKMICDGRNDCPHGRDETNCGSFVCPGMHRCRRSTNCVTSDQICDGKRDCFHGDDELMCDAYCPPFCLCDGYSVICSHSSFKYLDIPQNISQRTRHLDLSHNSFTVLTFNVTLSGLGKLVLVNSNVFYIPPRTFEDMANLFELDLSQNKIRTLQEGTFLGLENLRHLHLSGNQDLQNIEPRTFIGVINLPSLSITGSRLEFLSADMFVGLGNVTELNVSENEIEGIEGDGFKYLEKLQHLDLRKNNVTKYSKEVFLSLRNLKSLLSDSFSFCCLAPWVPKKNCFPQRGALSSCEDLLRIVPLRIFLWVIGAVAVSANVFVIVYRIKHPERNKVHGMILTNLAISDLLMGGYLIAIAIVDTAYMGDYFMHAQTWTSSPGCFCLGFIATVATEVSIMTLAMLTFDRFTNILFPFGEYKMKMTRVGRLLVLVWLVCGLLAGIPLLPLPYFGGQFYSRSGVCIPLHLSASSYPGWEYSVAIFMGLNTAIFGFIATAYWYIYQSIKNTSIRRVRLHNRSDVRTETIAARKMALLVFFNVLCWFPIFVIGCLALVGKEMGGDVYAWIVVFVLPINSAVDPILYTISTIKLSGCSSKAEEVGSRLVPSGCEDTLTFQSFQSDTSVTNGKMELQHLAKEGTLAMSLNRKSLSGIKTKLTLSTGPLSESSLKPTSSATCKIPLTNEESLRDDVLGAFLKSLAKTLLSLHENDLSLDWQSYSAKFSEMADGALCVHLEGNCCPVTDSAAFAKDRLHFQRMARKLARDRGANVANVGIAEIGNSSDAKNTTTRL